MKYEITCEPLPRAFIIGLLRSHLTDGMAFPSAVMGWLADALEAAHCDLIARALEGPGDPHHCELLESAARHMRALADRQRQRDEAHYADVVPHASADNVVTGENEP